MSLTTKPSAAATTASPATTTTTAPVASTCPPAPSRIVDIINGSFNDERYTLSSPALSVTAPGDLIYVSAEILRDGERAMSEAVWVASGAAVYALSGSVRRSSLLPDGRDALNASAGDDYGLRAQSRVAAAR